MLIKAISQKGTNVYQSFKVLKVTPQTGPEYNGQEYAIVDFKYELLTGAGFEVERRGIAAITSQGPGVETFWAASIRARYVKASQQELFDYHVKRLFLRQKRWLSFKWA
jgi:hypothetical protein